MLPAYPTVTGGLDNGSIIPNIDPVGSAQRMNAALQLPRMRATGLARHTWTRLQTAVAAGFGK
jgi:hypothetical protein